MIDEQALHSFQSQVQNFYRDSGRHTLPWRQPESDGQYDPYKILVSEMMLQQTQVNRVIPIYTAFINRFHNSEMLASATLGDVLRAWNGLGYNRRAKFLHEASRIIRGGFPQNAEELIRLPGIGPNTAGAILVYAFNQPAVFIETNIRTVFIHHFFANQTTVSDQSILELVRKTVIATDPRSWYWSLMDYGAYLKHSQGNPNKVSKTYSKQSKFTGSRRQIRGQVIRLLSERPFSILELQTTIYDERLASVLQDLAEEGLIRESEQYFSL